MELQVGQRVNDYEILRVLGAGGMGRVYCVSNCISGRTEAMKVLLPDLLAERDLAERFISEIRTLASFDHPNIAQLRTAFQYENQLVMVMEYVEGVTLEQQAKRGPMVVSEVVNYMSQTLSALAYAHGRGVVHRDIKPANMMVTSHGIVKLMDFGIAKSLHEPQLTRTGTTIGSMYYMSPEQVRGDTVDARSDIYSVGITLYELLAGRKPFEAQSTFSILNQQLNEAPKPLTEVNPAVPSQLSQIVLLALAKDPQQRFQTAEGFRNALRPFLPEQGTTWAQVEPLPPAKPQSASEPAFTAIPAAQSASAPRQAKSRQGLWIGLGAAAALAAILLAATVLPRVFTTHANTATRDQAPPGSASSAALTAAPASPTPSSEPLGASPASPVSTTGVADSQQPAVTNMRQGERRPPVTHTQANPGPNGAPNIPDHSMHVAEAAQPNGSSQHELEESSDRLLQFQARSSAVNQSIDRLRHQQEQDGLGLRGDMAAALSRMNSYEAGASRAIADKDAAAANRSLERAEKELDTLEKFLGK